MSLKIAIIGGGWYGCHIAASLNSLNFDITLFEQNNILLKEASGNNQFRLHLGFHYARDYRTRQQSRDGYHRFLERYEHLTKPIENNYYIVPTNDSLLDYMTYKIIMITSGIEFDEIHQIPTFLKNTKGIINTNERKILTQEARNYFKSILEGKIKFNTKVESVVENNQKVIINDESFDFVIDATWGHLENQHSDFFYEPTLLLYYRTKEVNFPALTYVDGPLCSLYPTEDEEIYTLSSVPFTPLNKFDCASDAREFVANITEKMIYEKRKKMENQMLHYFPDFNKIFSYESPQLSIKTKPIGSNDDRSCYVQQNGKKITVMSGKIDTIFYASQRIVEILEFYKK